MTAKDSRAVYACISCGERGCPKEIAGQRIVINTDIREVIAVSLNNLNCLDKL